MGQKRGQLSIFIIVGLVLLISIGSVVYVTQRGAPASLEDKSRSEDPTTQLQGIIQGCLQLHGVSVLRQLSNAGGTLKSTNAVMYKGNSYNGLCVDSPGAGCINTMLTKVEMAAEFDAIITPLLDACINLAPLEKKGYAVQQRGTLVAKSIIGFDTVTIELNMPLKLVQGTDTISFEKLGQQIQSPLGELHSLALLLLNQDIQNGYIDKDSWMKEHADIRIDIDRPYPDTVITLNTTDDAGNRYLFHFSQRGTSTANSPLEVRPAVKHLPTCKINFDCFDNTPSALCTANGGVGTTAADAACKPPFVKQELCEGKACKSCTVGGTTVTHGQQWCGTTVPRENGLDPVGNRFIKYSCFDGNLVFEPCRDYREQLCTQEGAISACRENKWHDCWNQQSQSACEDPAARDCYWNPGLVPAPRITFDISHRTSDRCLPYVAPGLQHWTKSGKLICQLGNEQVREEIGVFSQAISWKPPVVHANGMVQVCHAMGDCGNKVSVVDFKSKQFKSTTGGPDKKYNKPDKVDALNLRLKTSPFLGVTSNTFSYPEGESEFMKQKTRDYVNWWLAQDPIAVLTDKVPIWIRHSTHCKVWKGPGKDHLQRCDDCKEFIGGCGEYLCKSLGRKCIFTKDSNGYPHCATAGKENPLQVTLTFPGHTAVKTRDGYAVTEPLNPYTRFEVDVTTDRPAICTLKPLPVFQETFESDDPAVDEKLAIVRLASSTFSQNEYELMTSDFREPALFQNLSGETPDLAFLQFFQDSPTVLQLLGTTNAQDVIQGKIDTIKNGEFMKNNVNNNPLLQSGVASAEQFQKDTTKAVTTALRSNKEFNSVDNTVNMVVIYNDLKKVPPIVHMFLGCEDSSGEPTDTNIDITVKVKQDELPPEVINVTRTPSTLGMTFNEPTECGYSLGSDLAFDDMEPMSCDISRISTRKCDLQVPPGPQTVYVRCRDRPFAFLRGSLEIRKDGGLTKSEGGFIFKQEGILNVTTSPFARRYEFSVPVEESSMKFALNFGADYLCKYSTQNDTYTRMPSSMDCATTSCATTLDSSSQKNYYFICADATGPYQNENPKSFIYNFP